MNNYTKHVKIATLQTELAVSQVDQISSAYWVFVFRAFQYRGTLRSLELFSPIDQKMLLVRHVGK